MDVGSRDGKPVIALDADDVFLAEIARLGRKERKSRIAPIVPQSLFHQQTLIAKGMDRQQFDGRHAERSSALLHRFW